MLFRSHSISRSVSLRSAISRRSRSASDSSARNTDEPSLGASGSVSGATGEDDPPGRSETPAPDTDPNPPREGSSVFRPGESLADRLRREIGDLSDTEREMLRHYRADGPTTPQEAHAAAGGSGDRTDAYAANRSLRRLGLVEHVARGRHGYALPELVAEETDDRLGGAPDRNRLVRAVEATFLEDVDPHNDDAAEGSGTGDADADAGGADSDVAFGRWPEA